MAPRRTSAVGIVIAFLVSLGYSLALEHWMRPLSADGIHFHPWSSEHMMQSVPLGELRRHALQSLAHIHIQPPAFDAIRAALVRLWPALGDAAALVQVDLALYVLGAVLLGLLVAIVYAWLSIRNGILAGSLGAFIMLVHPASLLFATFLDSTLLSSVLILSVYFLLWRIQMGLPVSIVLFSVLVLALFLTRSIFQWPALVLLGVCLWLVGVPRRGLATYILVVGTISTLYLAKQFSQFGVLSTSSLTGVSLANSIGVGMGTAKYANYLDVEPGATAAQSGMPGVLTLRTKVGGEPNFNHIDYLELNRMLADRFWQTLRHKPIADLWHNYADNTNIYLRPSSTYSSGNVIVERLPWRRAFDLVFSAPILPTLLVLSLACWTSRAIQNRALRSSLGVLLPGLFVLLVSIVGDKGENMRFKFFLEPVMLVFVLSQAASLIGHSQPRPSRAEPQKSSSGEG